MIGWLGPRSPAESASVVAAFHEGLNETGYVEGKKVAIEYHWAELQDRHTAKCRRIGELR